MIPPPPHPPEFWSVRLLWILVPCTMLDDAPLGQVKANSITRQVTASYTTEELKAEIQITLPESYPLGGITVDAQRHAVVKQAQWERLLLQLNVFLQHQVCVCVWERERVCVCVCVWCVYVCVCVSVYVCVVCVCVCVCVSMCVWVCVVWVSVYVCVHVHACMCLPTLVFVLFLTPEGFKFSDLDMKEKWESCHSIATSKLVFLVFRGGA